uniref:Ig-like domain-containing protein n=1 Tax=Cyprinus carpio TaxID=7962 RepID=A0A8C1S1S7_CYPCA
VKPVLFLPVVLHLFADKPKINISDLSEGEETNLTCSAPFPCPEAPPEITWWIKKIGGNIIYLKDNITLNTSKNLYLSTLTLTPSSDLHNGTTLQILGNSKVMEGDTLSLNCTVESHPPSSDPVWSFNGTTETFMNQTFAGSFMITNVTKEHAGVYGCTRTYRNETLNASFTISIIRK